jgi:hypothetical protein
MTNRETKDWLLFNLKNSNLSTQALRELYFQEIEGFNINEAKKKFNNLLKEMRRDDEILEIKYEKYIFRGENAECESISTEFEGVEEGNRSNRNLVKHELVKNELSQDTKLDYYKNNEKAIQFFILAEKRYSQRMEDLDKLILKVQDDLEGMENKDDFKSAEHKIKLILAAKELIDKQLKHQNTSLEKLYKQMEVHASINHLLMAWQEVLAEMGDVFEEHYAILRKDKDKRIEFVRLFDQKLKNITSETINRIQTIET